MQENMMMDWLLQRGITEDVLSRFHVSAGTHHILGECIHIPVINKDGAILFRKYRRSPFTDVGEKYLYDAGSRAQLYGWHEAHRHPRVLVCEGELDALVAWSNNIPAVSSTGGAMTFTEEWASWLANKEVLVCYDNDDAGARGAVRTLKLIPHAKIVQIPDMPNLKDITDYLMAGGNLHDLLDTATAFVSLEQVREDRGRRIALFQSVRFHDAFISANAPATYTPHKYSGDMSTTISRAKSYPITNMVKFNSRGKSSCLWHAEKTASLHYYPKTNTCYCFGGCGRAYDAIDVYRIIHNCSFTAAVRELNKLV